MSDSPGRYHFHLGQELVDHFASEPKLRQNGRDFLLAGGVLAGHSDGEFSEDEQQYLAHALADAFGDDPSSIASIASPEMALAMLDASAAWLSQNGGAMKFVLFKHLAQLVAVDHVLHPDELRFVKQVAAKLGLAPDHASRAIQDVFEKK